jgi:hypothetical protein
LKANSVQQGAQLISISDAAKLCNLAESTLRKKIKLHHIAVRATQIKNNSFNRGGRAVVKLYDYVALIAAAKDTQARNHD